MENKKQNTNIEDENEEEFEVNKKFNIIRIIISIISVVTLLIINIFYGENEIANTNVNTLIILPICLILYIILSFDAYINAFKLIKEKNIFNEITFTLIATIAAFSIQEYVEALAIITFFALGELIEEEANKKSKKSIKSILELRPDSITLIENEKEKIIHPIDAKLNDIFIVKPGERVPLDGIIIKGSTSFDYSSMTGESKPVTKRVNDEVLSGVINIESPVYLKVIKEYNNSTVSKILDLVQNASNKKAKPINFITKFSKIYTPVIFVLSILISIIPPLFLGISDGNTWMKFIKLGAEFLVISCPCAFLVSVPLSYFTGIGLAAKYKVLIKGSHYLEKMNSSNCIAFDKTGTITKGNFEIDQVILFNDSTKNEVLWLASMAEYHSLHPIAKAILKENNIEISLDNIKEYKEIKGKGIYTKYLEDEIIVGNNKLLDEFNISYELDSHIGTKVYVSKNKTLKGLIIIKDIIKDDSIEAISLLNKVGIKNTYMLTGDSKEYALDVAKKCNISNVYSELLPIDKLNIINKIKEEKNNKSLIFVGDGVNDTPSLLEADIGISMGNIGSDAAIESSDIVIMDDNLKRVSVAKKISKITISVVIENLAVSLGGKFIIMLLTTIDSFYSFGLTPYSMWIAIFGDVGLLLITILNSYRILLKKIKY